MLPSNGSPARSDMLSVCRDLVHRGSTAALLERDELLRDRVEQAARASVGRPPIFSSPLPSPLRGIGGRVWGQREGVG